MVVVMQAFAMAAGPWWGARWLRRRRRVGWSPFAWGWASFLFSQLIHIPLLIVMLPLLRILPLAVVIPLVCVLAGLCEEPSRYLFLRWRYGCPTLSQALMLGLGHSACEAACLALWLLVGTLVCWVLPLDFLAPVASALLAWRMVAVVERWMATVLHMGASLLVRRSLQEQALEPLGRAILLHGCFNLAVIWVAVYHGLALGELAGLLFTLGIGQWIRSCWQAESDDCVEPASY